MYSGLYAYFISPLHTRLAGSGVQVPSTDIPSGDTQVALILPARTYPGLHLKTTSVALILSMIPFSGIGGVLQLTGERKLKLQPSSKLKYSFHPIFLHVPPRALNHYNVQLATYSMVLLMTLGMHV